MINSTELTFSSQNKWMQNFKQNFSQEPTKKELKLQEKQKQIIGTQRKTTRKYKKQQVELEDEKIDA